MRSTFSIAIALVACTSMANAHVFEYDAEPETPRNAALLDLSEFSEIERTAIKSAQAVWPMYSDRFPSMGNDDFARLFLALVGAESAWNVSAISNKGALGLSQLMPETARMLNVDPGNVIENLNGGARYLASLLAEFQSVSLALAAYNSGPNNVRKYGVIPPFKETKDFLKRVTRLQNKSKSTSLIMEY